MVVDNENDNQDKDGEEEKRYRKKKSARDLSVFYLCITIQRG